MGELTYAVSALLVGLLIGGVVTYMVLNGMLKKRRDSIIRQANKEAEQIKKDKILQAKEKFLQLKEEHEKVINERNNKLQQSENRFKQREGQLNKKIEDNGRLGKELERKTAALDQQLEIVNKKQEELKKSHQKQVEALEKLANYSAEEAKNQLVEALRDEAKTAAMQHIKDISDESKLTANMEAKKIVIQSIQRVAAEHAVENSVSVFNIESDEIKGRIIGREGRNIRAIEAATGVEVIVDDTPEAIILSCFDPVRREIARLSMHQLVTD